MKNAVFAEVLSSKNWSTNRKYNKKLGPQTAYMQIAIFAEFNIYYKSANLWICDLHATSFSALNFKGVEQIIYHLVFYIHL